MSNTDGIRCVRPSDTGSERDDEWLQEVWYKDNQIHRDGAPAIIHRDGTEIWYQNGKRHREDGPAVTVPREVAERGMGLLEGWYQNGVQHRIGGPAIVFIDGRKCYFEHGKKIREES